ncbi:hypothetical protein DAPPUDRAFT_276019, partial [Daphnia pulex]
MLTSTSGTGRVSFVSNSTDTTEQNSDDDDEIKSTTTLVCTCERVGSTPYIACIVTRHDMAVSDVQVLRRVPPTSLPDLVYHRLDGFSSPSKSWAEPSPVVIQSFMAFLSDKTKLIANPALRSAVRSDVGALAQLVPFWRSQFGHSLLRQFVVRRYAATATSGVMIEYPATVRPASFDPQRRP